VAEPADETLARVLAAALLFLAAAALCLPISNPDLFWHLSAGRWMVEHAAFPRADWLSHTLSGAAWSDFEWGTQLLWHGVRSAGGMAGLWTLKLLLLGASAAALWRLLRWYGTDPLGRALGIFAWAAALGPANDIRPENFSVLLFMLLLARLDAIRLGELRWPGVRGGAGWAALFALWANLHAGFAFGLVLLFIYAAGASVRQREAAPLVLCVVCAAAVLANPYGTGVYAVPLLHGAELGLLSRHLREWQPASILSVWHLPFWGLLGGSFASLLWRHIRRQDLPLEHLASCAVFGLWAAAHQRMMVYSLPVSILAVWSMVSHFPSRLRQGVGSLTAAGLAAFFFLKLVPGIIEGPGPGFVPAFVPVRAAAFIKAEREVLGGKRLFNPWHWGGFLGYRLFPDNQVFVDGRYIFHRFLEPMRAARQSPEAYAAFLQGFGADLLVVGREHQFIPEDPEAEDGPLLRPFYVSFLPLEEWALIHWDDRALVFVRRGTVPGDWLKEREYRWFRPDDLRAALRALSRDPGVLRSLETEVARFRSQETDIPTRQAAADWLRLAQEASPGGGGTERPPEAGR